MKSNLLQKRESVDKCFEWKDKNDRFHKISNMHTYHLFNTFLMIWNHAVREEFKFKPYHRYKFGSFYTVGYMKEAVRSIVFELVQRSDLNVEQVQVLSKIRGHLDSLNNVFMIE